jgi:uncharacterized coiled-coil protein SlyX
MTGSGDPYQELLEERFKRLEDKIDSSAERRITRLESDIEHIKKDLSDVKSDVSSLKLWLIGMIVGSTLTMIASMIALGIGLSQLQATWSQKHLDEITARIEQSVDHRIETFRQQTAPPPVSDQKK